MHELALAQSIIDTVNKAVQNHLGARVLEVRVRIGELTDVVPDSLQFGFESLIADTPMAGAKLEIERVPIRGKCSQCGREFEIEDYIFICPDCFSTDIAMLKGDELEIVDISVE